MLNTMIRRACTKPQTGGDAPATEPEQTRAARRLTKEDVLDERRDDQRNNHGPQEVPPAHAPHPRIVHLPISSGGSDGALSPARCYVPGSRERHVS